MYHWTIRYSWAESNSPPHGQTENGPLGAWLVWDSHLKGGFLRKSFLLLLLFLHLLLLLLLFLTVCLKQVIVPTPHHCRQTGDTERWDRHTLSNTELIMSEVIWLTGGVVYPGSPPLLLLLTLLVFSPFTWKHQKQIESQLILWLTVNYSSLLPWQQMFVYWPSVWKLSWVKLNIFSFPLRNFCCRDLILSILREPERKRFYEVWFIPGQTGGLCPECQVKTQDRWVHQHLVQDLTNIIMSEHIQVSLLLGRVDFLQWSEGNDQLYEIFSLLRWLEHLGQHLLSGMKKHGAVSLLRCFWTTMKVYSTVTASRFKSP